MPDSLWAAVGEAVKPYFSNPIVVALALLGLAYMTVSKKLAQITGPIGALARWWNGRQAEKVKRERALFSEQHAADREKEAAEVRQLREDVRYLQGEVLAMRTREHVRDQQAREHTAWDHDVVSRLQAAGIAVSDPPPLYPDLASLRAVADGETP